MTPDHPAAEVTPEVRAEWRPGPRSCLVCTEPTTSEGQLCPECVAKGCWVDDDSVHVVLEVSTARLRAALGDADGGEDR